MDDLASVIIDSGPDKVAEQDTRGSQEDRILYHQLFKDSFLASSFVVGGELEMFSPQRAVGV